MSLTFVGPGGSCEVPWIRYALLRDNVLHHLDRGELSPDFQELYRIGEALGGGSVRISARRLRAQIEKAQQLCQLSILNLAISARTRAVISMDLSLPEGPPTIIIGTGLNLPWISAEVETLGDIFGALVRRLLEVTEGAADEDMIEVMDS